MTASGFPSENRNLHSSANNVCASVFVAGAHGLVQRLVMDRAPSIFRQQQVAAVQAMAAATVRITPKQRTCRTGT